MGYNMTFEYDEQDIQKNKGIAVLSYLSILVLIPMFVEKHSRFTRFHVAQGFTLAVLWVADWIVFGLLGLIKVPTMYYVLGLPIEIMTTAWWVVVLNWLVNAALIALSIIGMVNVAKGQAKELPVVGRFILIR